jgi:hypothetical protein
MQYQVQISPATGKELHSREKSGLKYLTPEQHAKFWEAVIHWNKERFSEAKWQEALRRIERAKKESVMKVLGSQIPPRIYHSFGTPGGRQLLLQSSSSLTAPTGAHPLRPAELPRLETASPTTPRPRWDVVCAGPVTPLSATSGSKKGNAFAEGGFWANLTPKTPVTAVPVPATPITAILTEPWVPAVPTDPEAKATYDEVHEEVHLMSLNLCASRLALHSSSNSEYDVIHPSMVKPKDELLAAEFTLESRQVDLSKHIQPDLPEKIERFADEEAAALRSYSVRTAEELRDIDTWLHFDEKTEDLTTILEAQRDILRMNRDRRKNGSLRLSDQAVRLAWATKIVEDKEYAVESKADGSSTDSDEDEGYDYSNFVRSIKSISSQESLGDDEPDSLRSSGTTTDVYGNPISTYRDRGASLRSSEVPTMFTPGILPLRSRQGTMNTDDPSPSNVMRRSNATAHRKNLSVSMSIPSTNTAQMSPEEARLRRMGPSTGDLANWASELRKMEHKRAEMALSRTSLPTSSRGEKESHGSVDGVMHPAFRDVNWGEGEGGGKTPTGPPMRSPSLPMEYPGGLPPPPRPLPTVSGYNRKAATSHERRASGLPTRPVTGYERRKSEYGV